MAKQRFQLAVNHLGISQVGHVSDEELKIIASEPVEKHKFKVSDFRALDGLKETLEKNIVSVEGMLSMLRILYLLRACHPY